MTTSTTSTTTPRSAHATIRGYWWQFVVACLHWLDLDENEYLVCEGVEDVDLYCPARVDGEQPVALYEQLKDYQSQNISLGSKAGREILANFVSRYVEDICHTGKPRPTFRLVTTAKRADQSGDVDVIDLWQARASGDEPSDVFLGGIRIALSGAKKDLCAGQKSTPARAQRVQDALDWLDEEDDNTRWIGFLDSVEWCFEAPDLSASHDKLVEELQSKVEPSLAGLVAERLLVELITNVSLAGGGNQRFDKPRLEEILSATRQDLEQWAEEQAPSLAFMRNLLTLTLEETQATREQLVALSKVVDQNNALLTLLVDRGLLEAAPFGLTSATPVWDELKLHTRAAINTQPRVRINRHSPLPRATLRRLEEELVGGDEQRLFILEGAGGSGKSTALVTCARHLLEEPDSVVLLLNLDHITAGTPLDALVPNTPRRSPDRLLLDALEESGRSRGVLIIDQLDRLSQVSASSGAKRDYFDQIKQLIMRTIEHEQLRVLVACREFDRKSDSRMKPLVEHDQSKTLALGPLEDEDVRRVVEELGYTSTLTRGQLDILAIPLHLHLLAGLDRRDKAKGVPLDEYHLYERFWDDKRRALRPVLDSKWPQLHKQICNLFLTSKRRYVTEREIEDDLADIEKLVSEDIFRRTEDGFVYFHQRYEEYVFARYFDGDLIDYIRGEEESFLALDQVKAILDDRRWQPNTRAQYIQDLRALVFGEIHVSFQLLVRGLLSTQLEFIVGEFDLWRDMLASGDPFVVGEARAVLWSNPALIPEIQRCGLLDELFLYGTCNGASLSDEELSSVRIGLFKHLFEHHPEDGAVWFSRLLRDERNFPWLRRSISKEHCYSNRVIFDAFIESITGGLWVLNQRHPNLASIYNLPKTNVEWVPEVIAACIKHNLATLDFSALHQRSYDEQDEARTKVFASLVDVEMWQDLSSRAPHAVIRHLLPLVPELIEAFTISESECFLWSYIIESSVTYKHSEYRTSVLEAVDSSYEETSSIVSEVLGALAQNQTRTSRMFRWHLSSISRDEYLEQSIVELEQMIAAREQLWLPDRYGTVVRLLVAVFETSPSERWQSIIHRLVGYTPKAPDPENDTRVRDLQLYPILNALPREALSEEAIRLLEGFREQLPESLTEITDSIGPVQSVDNTDDVKLHAMSDDEVLAYVLESEPQPLAALPMFSTSKSATIRIAAGQEPSRFLALLDSQFEVLPVEIKNAIFGGWHYALQQQNNQEAVFSEEQWEHALNLVVRTYNESPTEISTDVTHFLDRCSVVPNSEVVDMVIDAMLNHPDPTEDHWSDVRSLSIGAINCLRGCMAEILGRWVANSKDVFDRSRDAIATACVDPSTQVRVCVALPVLTSLNYDRDFAVEQFLELVRDQPDELLATNDVERVLWYAIPSHLPRLDPIIERMLEASVEDVRIVGGILFGRSTFTEKARLARLPALMEDEATTRGLARVWKGQLQNLSGEQCQTLIAMFDHTSDEVLKELSGLFRGTKKSWFLENQQLLDAYLDARIARTRNNWLFYAFDEWKLVNSHPEIVLDVIDKMLVLHDDLCSSGETTSIGATHKINEALEAIYFQHPTQRARVKTILDMMVRANDWNAGQTLRKVQAHRD